MLNKTFVFSLLFIFTGCSTPKLGTDRKPAQADKPFHTALVISGENLNAPLFIGMIDGLASEGKVPDLIVASCGASMAAALIQSIPNRKGRLQYLTSKEYFDLVKNLQMDDPSLFEFAQRLWNLRGLADQQKEKLAESNQRLAPDVFSYSLLKLGPELLNSPGLHFEQTFSNKNTRVIIVAARIDYTPEEGGHFVTSERKLFTQTFFTDSDTGAYLKYFPSLPGTLVRSSSVAAATETDTSATLGEAVRASITDPMLVNPARYRKHYYLTGAVDIDPIDVAQGLADEVIARYPGSYNSIIEVPALMATFAFNGNEIRKNMVSRHVDYWIDGTTDYPNFSLGPQPNFFGALKSLNLGRTYKFGSKVPESYEEFVDIVKAQYRFGYQRAKEALSFPRFDRTHIQNRMESEESTLLR